MGSQEGKQVEWEIHIHVNRHPKRRMEIWADIGVQIVDIVAVMPAIGDIIKFEEIMMVENDTLHLQDQMMKESRKGTRNK